MRPSITARPSAFTLIELLVVVAIVALLISILLPALNEARQQTKNVKCLANLRSLGQGVVAYTAEAIDRLPRQHPAVYRNQGIDYLMNNPFQNFSFDNAVYAQSRYLSGVLRKEFADSSGREGSVSDQISTCPTLAGVNPESNFIDFKSRTGRPVFPTDYCINNVGVNSDQGGGQGPVGNVRTTDPPQYFGFSPWDRNDASLQALAAQYPPQPISKIKRSAEEWMIADAWYRERTGAPNLQQEGPYQVAWSGEALPNFAPHGSKQRSYAFSDTNERRSQSSRIRSGRQDGKTNTVFFDGHAEAVRSKRLVANGFELMYGFPGTVNPLVPLPPGAFWE